MLRILRLEFHVQIQQRAEKKSGQTARSLGTFQRMELFLVNHLKHGLSALPRSDRTQQCPHSADGLSALPDNLADILRITAQFKDGRLLTFNFGNFYLLRIIDQRLHNRFK